MSHARALPKLAIVFHAKNMEMYYQRKQHRVLFQAARALGDSRVNVIRVDVLDVFHVSSQIKLVASLLPILP